MPLFHDCHIMRFYMNEVFACIKKSIDMVVHIYIEIKNKVKKKGNKKKHGKQEIIIIHP